MGASRNTQNIHVTASTVLTNDQGNNGRLVIGTSALALNVTLPDNPGDGQEVKIMQGGVGALTILPGSLPAGTTVDGGANIALANARDLRYLRFDLATNDWIVVSAI